MFNQYNPDDIKHCAIIQDVLLGGYSDAPELPCMKFRKSDHSRLPYLPELGGAAWRPVEIPVGEFTEISSSSGILQPSTPPLSNSFRGIDRANYNSSGDMQRNTRPSDRSLGDLGHAVDSKTWVSPKRKSDQLGVELTELGHVVDSKTWIGPHQQSDHAQGELNKLGNVTDPKTWNKVHQTPVQPTNSLQDLGHVTRRQEGIKHVETDLKSEGCEGTAMPALYGYEYKQELDNSSKLTVWALKFEDVVQYEAFINYQTSPISGSWLLRLPRSLRMGGTQRLPLHSQVPMSTTSTSYQNIPTASADANQGYSNAAAKQTASQQSQYLALLKLFKAKPFPSFKEAEHYVLGDFKIS